MSCIYICVNITNYWTKSGKGSLTSRHRNFSVSGNSEFHVTPEDGLISRNKYIYTEFFLLFHVCGTRLEVPSILREYFCRKKMEGTYWWKAKSSFQAVSRTDDFQTGELARPLLDSTTISRFQVNFCDK